MQTNVDELSNAVVLFLGFGSASSPRMDNEGLIQAFGKAGLRLESQVLSLIDEVSKFKVDWSKDSLESAGHMIHDEMHRRHPRLSNDALRALAWKFTFDWR
ncbi:MAG TPA: hypothetical protein VFE47_01245 [Tepidisphaeraceae bacterium]|nr:hypothetical protein [Tepidisphaeraceae bacterium]